LQRRYLHFLVGDGLRDLAEGLVGRLPVIAPQRGRRPQQRHIGRGDLVQVQGGIVGRGRRQFTTAAHGDGNDASDDDGGSEQQYHRHMTNRAMLRPMVGTSTAPQAARTALLAVADTAAAAASAVAMGAGMVDLGRAAPAQVDAFRASHPGVLVCAAGGAADIVRDLATALRTGALLVCADPAAAVRAGIPAGRLLAEVRPAELGQHGVAGALAGGYATLVDLPDGTGPGPGGVGLAGPPGASAAALAVAAISAWLGVAVVRTRYPQQVRRALDMAESVRGTRPPARAVRGLA
jgi:dihydropteroate synthase